MSRTAPLDWHSPFIAAPGVSAPDDPAAWFRIPVTVTEQPVSARLRVTGLGLYEPWLDGQRIGDELLAPGWSSYRHRLPVSTFDVTEQLGVGDHVIGVVLGQGWARGPLANFFGGERPYNTYSDRAAISFALEVIYAARTETVVHDDRIRVTLDGPVRTNSIYGGETYDATRELDGWSAAGFDDSSWSPVEVVDWDPTSVIEPVAEPVRATQTLPVREVITTPSGATILDFGQNIAGWVRFRVAGERGRTVTLRHAEVLNEKGEPAYEPLRGAAATDSYTLRGEGEETWEPRFTYHGFRYCEVQGWPGEVDPAAFEAVVVHSDMTRIGTFSCSDERVEQLHRNVVWGLRGNFVSLPTDCPQRDERLGWTGDIHAFGPTAAYLYDVRCVLGSWLQDVAAEQRARGFVPWTVPDIFTFDSSPTALWSDVAVGLPWILYEAYGDTAVLERQYDSMTAYVRQVAARLDEGDLISSGYQFGDWLDPDAPAERPSEGKTDAYLMAQAFFVRATRLMARTASLLGRTDDAAEFEALAHRVQAAFTAEYVAPRGRLVNESVTAYALAICFGLLDDDQVVRAGRALARLVAKAGFRISTGFAGTPLVMDALTRSGHLDEAYRMLLTQECPSFLYPLTMGATTIWERWDSMLPDGSVNSSGMTSFNHYALGAVADWLHRTVAGLAPAEPGYQRIHVEPRPGGDLTFAEATLQTPYGLAAVRWERDGGAYEVAVTVPDGSAATVVLPEHPDGLRVDVGPGEHRWTYEVAVTETEPLSMDSTLAQVAAQPRVWSRVTAVFDIYLPGIPIDGHAPEAAAVTLTGLLGMIPGVAAGMADDLARALEAE